MGRAQHNHWSDLQPPDGGGVWLLVRAEAVMLTLAVAVVCFCCPGGQLEVHGRGAWVRRPDDPDAAGSVSEGAPSQVLVTVEG